VKKVRIAQEGHLLDSLFPLFWACLIDSWRLREGERTRGPKGVGDTNDGGSRVRSPSRRSPSRRSPCRRSPCRRSPCRRWPSRRSPCRRSACRGSPCRRWPCRRSPSRRSPSRRFSSMVWRAMAQLCFSTCHKKRFAELADLRP